MNWNRVPGLAIAAVLGGIVVWTFGESTRNPAPADAPERSVGAASGVTMRADPAGVPDRDVDELQAALAESNQRLAEIEAALASADANLAAANAALEANEKYPKSVGMAYLDLSWVRPIHEGQAVDPDWAPAAETEIADIIATTLPGLNLPIAGQAIDCRTDVCRVQITHASAPTSREELAAIGDAIEQIGDSVIENSPSITTLVSNNRAGFTAELATTEIFFYRRGNADPIYFFETPSVRNRIGAPELP